MEQDGLRELPQSAESLDDIAISHSGYVLRSA
jgi:hypothetical protein